MFRVSMFIRLNKKRDAKLIELILLLSAFSVRRSSNIVIVLGVNDNTFFFVCFIFSKHITQTHRTSKQEYECYEFKNSAKKFC